MNGILSGYLSGAVRRFLFVVVLGVLAPLPLSALTKTITVPFDVNWHNQTGQTSGWGCGDFLPILRSGTFTTSFSGGLPTGSNVKNVKITMPMRRAGVYYAYGDADPVVTASISGQQIAGPNVVAGLYQCPLVTDLIPYTFDHPFPNGFAAYNLNGTNALTFNIQGGTCPYWCGVTTNNSIVTIEVTYDPPPPAEFAITSQASDAERRILVSNAGAATGYAYPHFQQVGGAKDAEVSTFLRAKNQSGNFQAGLTVYMRILDPADSAAYMNQPGNVIAHTNDNEGGGAILDGPGVTVYSPGVYQATSGANGQTDFTLKLQAPFVAGDNYQIEASLDAAFPAGGTAKSGILTAWKRIFIERRKMLRNGLFLAQNANAGDTYIVTRGNHWFGNRTNHDELSKSEKIVIVHAPQISRVDLNQGWYLEFHTILSVVELGNNLFRVNLGTKQGNTIHPEPLQHDYRIDMVNPRVGDGISKLDSLSITPADVFDAPMDLLLGEAFRDSFTENIVLPDLTTPGANVPVPFLESSDQLLLQDLAEKWSSVANPTLAPNHQLLIMGSDNNPIGPGDSSDLSDAAGLTISQVGGRTSSYVFLDGIDQQLSGGTNNANIITWARKTAAHEIAHQWQTNSVWPVSGPSDHCPETTKTWNDANLYCLLASFNSNLAGSQAQRTNGIARFHLMSGPSGGWHSEYLGIRRRSDPLVP